MELLFVLLFGLLSVFAVFSLCVFHGMDGDLRKIEEELSKISTSLTTHDLNITEMRGVVTSLQASIEELREFVRPRLK